jgi:hypothetical protein
MTIYYLGIPNWCQRCGDGAPKVVVLNHPKIPLAFLCRTCEENDQDTMATDMRFTQALTEVIQRRPSTADLRVAGIGQTFDPTQLATDDEPSQPVPVPEMPLATDDELTQPLPIPEMPLAMDDELTQPIPLVRRAHAR